MSTANVNDFRSTIARGRDFAKANRFAVFFNLPLGISGSADDIRDLSFLCETSELPGRALNVQEYRYYGPNFKMPHQSAYTDINFTIYVRSFMNDKRLFDNWIEYINPKTTYDFRFRNEYSTDINIFQYEEDGKESYKVTLQKAYPINVNPMPLAWAEDNIHRLQVSFCYVDWRKDDDAISNSTVTLDDQFERLREFNRVLNNSRGGRTTVGGGV